MLYVNRARCTGCAVCADVCPTGAIRLDEKENVAIIDQALCTECLVCLDECPSGAIQRAKSSELVAMEGKAVEGEVIEGEVMPAPASRLPAPARSPGRLAALAGAALTFVGNQLLPRVADALVSAVEHRLAHETDPISSTTSPRSGSKPLKKQVRKGGRGHGRQRRQRRRGQ